MILRCWKKQNDKWRVNVTKEGFHYYLEPEKIREYRRLSPEHKLKWLEEIFLFSEMVMTPEAKKIRTYFREKTRNFPPILQ